MQHEESRVFMSMEIKKAVTFRASSIGDSLMAKYFLENIHAMHPNARCILLVAGKGDMVRDLLGAYPWIEIIEANMRHPMTIVKAFKECYQSDCTVTQYSGRGQFGTGSKIFARLITKKGGLTGFADAWPFNRFLYDKPLPFDSRRALRLHERDALRSLGVEPVIPRLTLKYLPGNLLLERLNLRSSDYIVLNLFSGTAKRGLALDHQIRIARALQETYGARKKIVLTGGPADESLVLQICEAVPALYAARSLSMQELITLVAESAGTVSLDTGVAHIAAQTSTPLVVLRTCWGYNWWNEDQYPGDSIHVLSHDELCMRGHLNKDFPDCLGAITNEEVMQAISAVFKYM